MWQLTSLSLLTRASFLTRIRSIWHWSRNRVYNTPLDWIVLGTMLTRNYTVADDPSSSTSQQADSRLSLGSPLSQGGDTEEFPSREYTSTRIIYAHQNMDIDDNNDDDMRSTRSSTTLSDFDQRQQQQQFEQDVRDLSIAHHSSYAAGGSDRVLRSMRHAHGTNMRRCALASNNEQHTNGLLPSSTRSSPRLAWQKHTNANGSSSSSSNQNEDGQDRSTPTTSTNHEDQEQQQRQREGLEALTRIEIQFAELRNR